MYPLTNVGAPLNKQSIDNIDNTFTKASPVYPLTNLGSPLNKELIDKIDNTF